MFYNEIVKLQEVAVLYGQNKIFYSSEIDYSKKTDEELVEIIKTGDKLAANYIIDRYKNLVNIKVSKYYIAEQKKTILCKKD